MFTQLELSDMADCARMGSGHGSYGFLCDVGDLIFLAHTAVGHVICAFPPKPAA